MLIKICGHFKRNMELELAFVRLCLQDLVDRDGSQAKIAAQVAAWIVIAQALSVPCDLTLIGSRSHPHTRDQPISWQSYRLINCCIKKDKFVDFIAGVYH